MTTHDSLEREDQEVAGEIAHDADALLSTIPHYYRGEVSQTNNAQNRIDQTTNWVVTIIAALLSVVLADPSISPNLLLVGVVVLGIFLSYEARRYRFYDLYRSRVRFVQQNVFANALDPKGVEHSQWREELGDDLRYPKFKVTLLEALSRRLRRIYGLLFVIVGLTWVVKITILTPETTWSDAAALPGIPGEAVAGVLSVVYLCIAVVAFWPSSREATGEIHGEEPGKWKRE
ncbi:DUF2270 domain-containing protein [Haloprofundus sp. MHR1]|uniref:DUF2270 domain-containing protein n=1 Tax=Haloprofundus sp. MHR1 TaxID=2572921 RepID=UPI0010BF14B7|nr:DUF2270 domain-containing protein [Haloprofundus sp. MHR1]QCJ45932.1 DUF2270 domain-containing protein [Haloprofundus sp. MHR1]